MAGSARADVGSSRQPAPAKLATKDHGKSVRSRGRHESRRMNRCAVHLPYLPDVPVSSSQPVFGWSQNRASRRRGVIRCSELPPCGCAWTSWRDANRLEKAAEGSEHRKDAGRRMQIMRRGAAIDSPEPNTRRLRVCKQCRGQTPAGNSRHRQRRFRRSRQLIRLRHALFTRVGTRHRMTRSGSKRHAQRYS